MLKFIYSYLTKVLMIIIIFSNTTEEILFGKENILQVNERYKCQRQQRVVWTFLRLILSWRKFKLVPLTASCSLIIPLSCFLALVFPSPLLFISTKSKSTFFQTLIAIWVLVSCNVLLFCTGTNKHISENLIGQVSLQV